MRQNFPYVGSVYLFLIQDEKILLLRRFQTGYEDGNYGLPAGHMEGNETARESCAREVREEIGIEVDPEHLTVVHVMHRNMDYDERIDFFMTAGTYTGEIRNMEPHKCDELSWFPLDALPPNTIEYIRVAINNFRNGIPYSEYGWKK